MHPQLQTALQQAIQNFQGDNVDGAKLILQRALQDDINSAETIFELGIAYAQANKFPEASTIFYCLQPYQNDDVRIPYNLGLIYAIEGKHELAIQAYDHALKIQPDDVAVLINKGSSCNDVKNYVLALEVLEKAIHIKSNIPEAWCNKGIALNNLNLYQESVSAYNKALSLRPDYAEAWSNKSVPLNKLRRFLEASESCDKALGLRPHYAEAWSNKGLTLSDLKRYDEAIAHYNKALTLKPDIDWVFEDLVHAKMKICSWSNLAAASEAISKKVIETEKVLNPFSLLALHDDALLHKKTSKTYIKFKYPCNSVLGSFVKNSGSHKIRVGYFSADFHNHATGHLMAELFELHDKNQFEVVGFSFGPIINDEMRQRLKKSFDKFIEVGDKTDMEIASLSRDLNIDIALDLKGFTQDSRTGIFSYRAAPIQVNYLGYPGTMGADYIDYIIADETLIPSDFQSYYSEKVVYLPGSYQANDRKRLISDKSFTRRGLGLPENVFVFCCFNNNYKIMPATFTSWMRILKEVEGSVLWLFQDNPWVVDNLRCEALNCGVEASRLIFAETMHLSEHLARHRLADLFLDTFPYNAHTTASDALWAGLPVLTLAGRSFASRVAASLLTAIRLPELITSTQEEYEALAIELAMNPKKFEEIKLKLANNRLITPLFDTPLFTKNLEASYMKMMERYQAGLNPDHIYITSKSN